MTKFPKILDKIRVYFRRKWRIFNKKHEKKNTKTKNAENYGVFSIKFPKKMEFFKKKH